MRGRFKHIILCVAAVTMLSGCASNCNILSSSNSFGCDAMMMGGMIVAAPIMAPGILLSDAASNAKTKRMAKEWESSMRTRLEDNDIEAIQECLIECHSAWRYQVDSSIRRQFQLDAAKRFVAGVGQDKSDESRAYTVLAHYVQSWQPESQEEDARFVLIPEEVRKSHALLIDEATRSSLKKLLSYSRYNDVTNRVYGMRYAIDTSPDDSAARTQFSQCHREMGKIIQEDTSSLSRTIACSRAYAYRFRESVPADVRAQWKV